MAVSEAKQRELKERMAALGICEDELKESFILGSGRGGQKVQKTHSCVYLCHLPTGIEIKCQKDRSREINRFLARRELCDRLEEQKLGRASPKQKLAAKIQRQKQRRTRRRRSKNSA